MKTPFPRTGQYFCMINLIHSEHSHNNAIMQCLASDANIISFKIIAESFPIDRDRIYFITRTQWAFYPVSRAVVALVRRTSRVNHG